MKTLRYYIARVKAYQSGWTIEAYPSGSGGWWFKVYDAYSGTEAWAVPERLPTFKKALLKGMRIARATRLPQKTIDARSEEM